MVPWPLSQSKKCVLIKIFFPYENLRKFYFTKQRRTRLGLGLREVCATAPCLFRPFLPRLRRSPLCGVPMRKSLSAGSRISFFHFHIPSCAHILVRFAARRRHSCPTFCLQPITGIKLRRAALWYAHRCTLLKFRLKMRKILWILGI